MLTQDRSYVPYVVKSPHAVLTDMKTEFGEFVYDLDPQAGDLWAVAGRREYDPVTIDPDDLPVGFRWIQDEEWERLQANDFGNGTDHDERGK